MNNLLTKKFPITALILLCVLTLSCSKERSVELPEKPDGTDVVDWQDSTINGDAVMSQMAFTIGSNMVVKQQATTRTTTNYDGTCTFSENDLIAVAVTRNSTETIKLYKVKSNGGLEYAGNDNAPFKWENGTETISVRAWSYGTSTNLSYTLDAPETFDYSLQTDQETNGYQELLYCKAANKSYSSSPIALTFYHQLARVVFNVNHEQPNDLSVTSVSVGNDAFPVTARFAVPTGNSNVGTWTTGTTYNTITPKADATQDGYQRTYSAVVFPKTYAKDSKIFTLTNDDGNYVYNISESSGQTLSSGNQYNYTISIKDGVFRKNPLLYVATQNMLNATTMATAYDAGYYFLWTDAMSKFAAQSTSYNDYRCAGKTITGQEGTWHMPTLDEWRSIIPGCDYKDGSTIIDLFDFDNGTGTYKPSNLIVKFGYNAETRAGVNEASYWKKVSSTEIHAIRFLGTSYCSAWKYSITADALTVYSAIIENVANSESAAAAFYNTKFSSISFSTSTARGSGWREFYSRGYTPGASSTPDNRDIYGYKKCGQYWSTTRNFDSNTGEYTNNAWLAEWYYAKSKLHTEFGDFVYARPIRMFKDYK